MANKAYPVSICPGIPRLGPCPNGWMTLAYGDVLRTIQRSAKLEDAREYQLINVKRSRGGIVPRSQLKGKNIQTKTQFFVKSGDFLIANRQIVHGACGVVPEIFEGAIVSNEYTTFRPKEELCLPFFEYFTHSVHFQQTCFHSSIGVDVEKMVFKLNWWLKHKFHLPQPSEQKEIADVLFTWDEAIQETRNLMRAKINNKKGLMQQLLSGKRRISSFTGQWTEHQLGELFSERKETNYGHLRLLAVTRDRGIIPASEIDRKDKSSLNKSQYKRIVPGDIGYNTMRMWQGVSAVSGLEGIVSPAYTICKPTSAIDPIFMGQLFKFVPVVHLFWKYSQGLVDDTLNLKFQNFAQIKVKIPAFDEQKSIAKVLSYMNREIEVLEKKLAALEKQKRGLMQKLLTGEIRVKV